MKCQWSWRDCNLRRESLHTALSSLLLDFITFPFPSTEMSHKLLNCSPDQARWFLFVPICVTDTPNPCVPRGSVPTCEREHSKGMVLSSALCSCPFQNLPCPFLPREWKGRVRGLCWIVCSYSPKPARDLLENPEEEKAQSNISFCWGGMCEHPQSPGEPMSPSSESPFCLQCVSRKIQNNDKFNQNNFVKDTGFSVPSCFSVSWHLSVYFLTLCLS